MTKIYFIQKVNRSNNVNRWIIPQTRQDVLHLLHLYTAIKNPTAGILALSEMSMLEPDAVGTYAISRRDKRVKGLEDSRYEGDYVQVWKYDPAKFSSVPDRVDPLSLYLSLKDDPDPRVQGELKTVMEEMKW